MEWSTGERTWEPLNIFHNDEKEFLVALHGEKLGLLKLKGWKSHAKLAKQTKKLKRMAKQAKVKSQKNGPRYKYGVQVPRNHKEAMYLDSINGNTKWAGAEKKERDEVASFSTFRNLGRGVKLPPGYKMIMVHMVYDVKHDGRHKARLVANGNLTSAPGDNSNYSGVVSLRSVRLVAFGAELNGLELWGADVSNAYLESYTPEKVAIIAGPEFVVLGLDSKVPPLFAHDRGS